VVTPTCRDWRDGLGAVHDPSGVTRTGRSYGYFVEITDGNVRGDANIRVFQPHRFFTVPA
jgi:hypothetical protein